MKVFAFALLCIVAAVHSRILDVADFSGTLTSENPWVVHLRVARSTGGGLLDTCAGTLIDSSWVLTSANCAIDARFVWIRYGAQDVIRPELVTETSIVRLNPDYNAETGENNIALVGINRVVEFTEHISPVPLATLDAEVPSEGRICGYGAENGAPGEQLACVEATVAVAEDGSITAESDDGQPTEYDLGAPLVKDGVQYGVLTGFDGRIGKFLNPAPYRAWIQEVAGIEL